MMRMMTTQMTVKVSEMNDRKHMLIFKHTCPNTFVLDYFPVCLSPRATWMKDTQQADKFLYQI